jgi:uncharacterized protein (TIGR03435 family)
MSLKDYIGMAYALDPPQVIAPVWTRDTRFEIVANLPPGDGQRREQCGRHRHGRWDLESRQ